jgi:4-amino-4-deoxy-L-arabinose transferase-like glycosyltransferase
MLSSPAQRILAGLLLVAIFALGILFITRLWLGDSFSKEEAQHALYGLWIYKDLKNLDWTGFWYDTQRQMFWPFLHSWLQAIFFWLFGISYLSARLLSFLAFGAILISMYLISLKISEKDGWKIGSISVLLALTSPMMVRYACESTLEGVGALLFLICFYLYVVCQEEKVLLYYVPLAFLLGLSLFYNYFYAYLMLPAFLVATVAKLGPITRVAIRLRRRGESAAMPFLWWGYRKLIVLAILLVLAMSWFFSAAFSRKILILTQAIFRNLEGTSITNFWQSLFYYPWTIVRYYTFSPWLGTLVLLSLFLPFVAFYYGRLGKLYTFVWTVLILVTLTVPTKAPQFIFIIAPFLYIIFSAALLYFVEKKEVVFPWSGKAKILLLILILFPSLFSWNTIKELYFTVPPRERMRQVLDYFHQTIPPRFPIAIVANLRHLNPEGISFHFWDWNAPVLTDLLMGEEEILKTTRYFFSVEIDPQSPYQKEVLDNSLTHWNDLLKDWLGASLIREYSERRFKILGLTAKIYEKKK